MNIKITTSELGPKFYPIELFNKDFKTTKEIENYKPLMEYFSLFEGMRVTKLHILGANSKHCTIVKDKEDILAVMYSQYEVEDYNMKNLIKKIKEPKQEIDYECFNPYKLSANIERLRCILNK